MPFPLAHPAAVLPLRRFCTRWLNLPALVIGTLVPDAGYLFRHEEIGGLSGLSHELMGSIAFGLPIGVLMLAALYLLRTPLVEMLPNSRRRVFLKLCRRPIGPLWLAALSLMIGIWTHVFWDSFTHNDGWIVGHLSILQTPLFHFDDRTARLCHLLWYASSFAGMGWLFVAFENWRWSEDPGLEGTRGKNMIQDAMLLSVLVIPVSLVHHMVRSSIVLILTALLCVLLALLFAVKMTRPHRDTPL